MERNHGELLRGPDNSERMGHRMNEGAVVETQNQIRCAEELIFDRKVSKGSLVA